MIPNFCRDDFSVIGHYLGRILAFFPVLLGVPLAAGVLLGEWDPVLSFAAASSLSLAVGLLLLSLFPRREDLNWRQGMTLVSLTWFLLMPVSAVPLYMSGHYGCMLDACFEAMSAYATTGLVLVRDVDHMALSLNVWRHFMCFIGGQGIIMVALIFFFKGSGALRIYVGEARDEKILPNIITTSRFIWLVSMAYLVVGSLMLAAVLAWHGVSVGRSLFHGVCIFMAGWDTAGFSPQSQNVLYYHSFVFELVSAAIFLLGATSFAVHYAVWTGRFRELARNFEMRVFVVTILLTFLVAAVGFARPAADFPNLLSFFRATFYHTVSAHTGVGYSNVTVPELASWSDLSLMGIVLAMAFGGCANSTSGGIKVLRLGILYKHFRREIRRYSYPEGAMVTVRFHHLRDVTLEQGQVRTALFITICYIILYTAGALAGTAFGYGFLPSLFESVSAAANVGLSVGITSPAMPAALKVVYILEMWVGRLEFVAFFVMMRFLVSFVRT